MEDWVFYFYCEFSSSMLCESINWYVQVEVPNGKQQQWEGSLIYIRSGFGVISCILWEK